MSRRRDVIAIVIPLLIATAAAIVFLRLTAPKKAPLVPVVVAAGALKAGHVISPQDVRIVLVPKALPGELANPAALQGEVLIVSLAPGEAVQQGDVTSAVKAPLVERLPQGERAVSLALPPVAAVGYVLQKGDRVDVIATFNAQTGVPSAPISIVALADVPVLGVRAPAAGATQGLVTLEVTPQEAATLELADQVGTVDLALRPASDTTMSTPSTKAGSLP